MAFRFKHSETVLEGLRRIAREQIDGAVRTVDADKMSEAQKVHDLRKRCKKLRGLVRLVRPSLGKDYRAENAWFRDTARPLSELRDAKVRQDTYDRLMEHYADQISRVEFGPVSRALTLERKALDGGLPIDQHLADACARFVEARERVAGWPLAAGGFKGLRGGLSKTYARARVALRKARKSPSPEAFHEARKRVKYHWHHCRLLCGAWPTPLKARGRESRRLADLLGQDHDLAVLAEQVGQDPCHYGPETSVNGFLQLIERRREELEADALVLGGRLFAEKPDVFCDRLAAYWRLGRG
ncbi:MAG: CHAD domain-containing protein [Planctomycetales bacterium]|nr:CHAD domain-containing protein [Planctomycetales bacterium]